ncbi:hypothetical protein [Streptomyces wuyuanensis]|uniref:hypothetical protein n=1 Tax=Streptomyces wuyuanensis TaxID=1196353 RepID=UPI003416111A
MRARHVDFMPTAELAPALGIKETDPSAQGTELSGLLKVKSYRPSGSNRGYRLEDLRAAAAQAAG